MGIAMNSENLYCSKCRRTMAAVNFYTYKNGTKCELCKNCLTMHINNFDPDTFLWILEKFDVPYIEAEWNSLRDRAYQKDPYKMNGLSVIGKYLSKMKLNQFKKYTWADTQVLKMQAEEQAKLHGGENEITEQKLQEMEEAYHNGEITEAQYMTYKQINEPEPQFAMIDGAITSLRGGGSDDPKPTGGVIPAVYEQVELPDVGAQLTQEDKIYLATKWGQLYTPADWVYLETKYQDFMSSFDIQGAARTDTLIQICKLSLKMNQALDSGDMDSYSKLVKAYDSLMKSAKFTEAQNKDGDSSDFDSASCIVAFCEKEGGFIEDMEITEDRDVVDTIIRDNHEYLETLIFQDKHLAQVFEQHLKKQENLAQQKEDRKKALSEGKSGFDIDDDDYHEYANSIREDLESDDAIYYDEESDNN